MNGCKEIIMSKNSSTPQDKPANQVSFLLAMLVGAILTMGIGLFIYLWNPFNQSKTVVAEETTTIRTKEPEVVDKPNYEFYDVLQESQQTSVNNQAVTGQTEKKASPAKELPQPAENTANANTSDKSESEVTHDLPDLTGKETDDNAVATTNNGSESQPVVVDVKPNTVYFLRINSYDNVDDADRRRAEVLMVGVDAQIIKRQLNDGTEVFEVISRVMPTQQQVMDARQRLQDNGIDAIIAEQTRK